MSRVPLLPGRMQQFEVHPVPGPVLPAFARRQLDTGNWFAATHLAYRQRIHQARRTARVIAVGMADQQQIDPRIAGVAQCRRDDRPPGIEALAEARAGIVDQGVFAGAHDHRGALPDIEHP